MTLEDLGYPDQASLLKNLRDFRNDVDYELVVSDIKQRLKVAFDDADELINFISSNPCP